MGRTQNWNRGLCDLERSNWAVRWGLIRSASIRVREHKEGAVMKTIALAAVALVATCISAAATDIVWLDDFGQAKKIAAEKKLTILADFSGSDWCGWCIRLDKEVFSQEAFKSYANKNVILFVADFPSHKKLASAVTEQNKKLADEYKVEGFPTVLLLNADGKVMARTGYKPGGAEAYVEHLKGLIGQAGKTPQTALN